VLGPKDIEPEILLVSMRLPPVCELLDVYITASMCPANSTADLLRIPITLPPADSRQRILAKLRHAWEAKVKARTKLEASQSACRKGNRKAIEIGGSGLV
jgi:hypothetical protein